MWQILLSKVDLQTVYMCTAFKLYILSLHAFLQNQHHDLGIIFVLQECYKVRKLAFHASNVANSCVEGFRRTCSLIYHNSFENLVYSERYTEDPIHISQYYTESCKSNHKTYMQGTMIISECCERYFQSRHGSKRYFLFFLYIIIFSKISQLLS